jgi:hypothetical protein
MLLEKFISKESTMKKRFLVIVALLPLLAGGCAGLMAAFTGETNDIDASTTVIQSDGTIIWAAKIDQFARAAADNKASRQRQVTRQRTVWKPVGFDYDFNQGELNVGIAQGKYKLGEAVYMGSDSQVGFGEYTLGSPKYAYPVYLKTTENVTSTVTDVDKELWQETYAETSARYQDYIMSILFYIELFELVEEIDVARSAEDPGYATENASPVRKKVMARLEERLHKGLLPGTHLIYGGWKGDKYEQENVLYAYLADDGSFICFECEWQ